ncbi:hypothetical protein BT67DRAFT_139362 [Trichocladium antarcticum]|uniref:Uncharacterized protein n=1 Tax=Trichocladium antarcticum TaxID=1450529 RepID=A0AAN6ZAK0_9PEZI|nr:hypothetical protein BT67DRAFT_139362 [Trichocladium antarcticum]
MPQTAKKLTLSRKQRSSSWSSLRAPTRTWTSNGSLLDTLLQTAAGTQRQTGPFLPCGITWGLTVVRAEGKSLVRPTGAGINNPGFCTRPFPALVPGRGVCAPSRLLPVLRRPCPVAAGPCCGALRSAMPRLPGPCRPFGAKSDDPRMRFQVLLPLLPVLSHCDIRRTYLLSPVPSPLAHWNFCFDTILLPPIARSSIIH